MRTKKQIVEDATNTSKEGEYWVRDVIRDDGVWAELLQHGAEMVGVAETLDARIKRVERLIGLSARYASVLELQRFEEKDDVRLLKLSSGTEKKDG